MQAIVSITRKKEREREREREAVKCFRGALQSDTKISSDSDEEAQALEQTVHPEASAPIVSKERLIQKQKPPDHIFFDINCDYGREEMLCRVFDKRLSSTRTVILANAG